MDTQTLDFRAKPGRGYWSWVRESLNFGPFALWVGWMQYQAMMDDLVEMRKRSYQQMVSAGIPPEKAAYWLT